MPFGGPSLDNVADSLPGGIEATLRYSRPYGSFGYDFFLLQRAVDFGLHDEAILSRRGAHRQFGLTGFYFNSHNLNN